MVSKIFFCFEFPDIPDKAGRKNEKKEKKNKGNCKALCVSGKRKKLVLSEGNICIKWDMIQFS